MEELKICMAAQEKRTISLPLTNLIWVIRKENKKAVHKLAILQTNTVFMLGVYKASCLPSSFASTGEMLSQASAHDMGHAGSSWSVMPGVTTMAILIPSLSPHPIWKFCRITLWAGRDSASSDRANEQTCLHVKHSWNGLGLAFGSQCNSAQLVMRAFQLAAIVASKSAI